MPPPQPGVFEPEYYQAISDKDPSSSRRKPRASSYRPTLDQFAQEAEAQHDRVKIIRGSAIVNGAGSKSSGSVEPERRDRDMGKRKREVNERVNRYGRDMADRRDEIYTNSLTTLTTFSRLLHQSPADSAAYSIRLYPLALERAALIDALELEEQHALDSIRTAWKAESSQIEDEYRKGKLRLRERVVEGLEERRRRAREEKEGDGVVSNDVPLESLGNMRNSSGPSRYTPPFVLTAPAPYGLAPDDLASPFPLSLTSMQPPSGGGGAAANRKPRQNRNGGREGGVLTLGKAIAGITASKDAEVDHDLGEIRRAVKRRKAAVKAAGKDV